MLHQNQMKFYIKTTIIFFIFVNIFGNYVLKVEASANTKNAEYVEIETTPMNIIKIASEESLQRYVDKKLILFLNKTCTFYQNLLHRSHKDLILLTTWLNLPLNEMHIKLSWKNVLNSYEKMNIWRVEPNQKKILDEDTITVEIYQRNNVIIKKTKIPDIFVQKLNKLRNNLNDELMKKQEFADAKLDELELLQNSMNSLDELKQRNQKEMDELRMKETEMEDMISMNSATLDRLALEIDILQCEIEANTQILVAEKLKDDKNTEIIETIESDLSVARKQVIQKMENHGALKDNTVEISDRLIKLLEFSIPTLMGHINTSLDFHIEQSHLLLKKQDEILLLSDSLKEFKQNIPALCYFDEKFDLNFWVQILIGNAELLKNHKWGTSRFFFETTEDKIWLKNSLDKSCSDHMLNYIHFNCLDEEKVVKKEEIKSSVSAKSKLQYGNMGIHVKSHRVIDTGDSSSMQIKQNSGDTYLLWQNLKSKIDHVLENWKPNGFIIKPSRGAMSQGNILVKRKKDGFQTRTVDHARNYEKTYRNFKTDDELKQGIYGMIHNSSTWQDFPFMNKVLQPHRYERFNQSSQIEILIEEVMDMPDDWFYPFELRITFLYGKPLVIWLCADHTLDLIVWRSDDPYVISHWDTLHYYNNKSALSTEDFYDEKLILEIILATTNLAKNYNFVYGRIDVFTFKRNGKFVWYVNEVQNHGLTPDMIYPNFIDTDDTDELTYFRSIFPLNFYDTYLGENNDNSEIPNLYTLVDNICKLFPDDTNKTQLKFLYEERNPVVYQLFQKIIIFKVTVSDKRKTDEQLKVIRNLLEKIKSF